MLKVPTMVKALLWCIALVLTGLFFAGLAIEFNFNVALFEDEVRFERPWAALLLLGPLLVSWARWGFHRDREPRLLYSRVHTLKQLTPSWKHVWRDAPKALRFAALCLVVLALMGPQSIHANTTSELSGIEIMICVDMSGSMDAVDIRPNRFVATQDVVGEFIAKRPNDRIGAVVFAKEAYTLLPLTTDKQALGSAIAELELEQIDPKGTAIGNAIGVALNRLRHTQAKSKVIILLTDGESNAGNVTPSQAAELAQALDVKIFPILMGISDNAAIKTGVDLFGRPVYQRGAFSVNPELLQRIATQTQAEFFAADDRESLETSFHRILDDLEKSEIEDAGKVYGELYPAFVWPGALFLLLEAVLGLVLIRRWP